MKNIIPGILLGASLIISAPAALADKGDGWQKNHQSRSWSSNKQRNNSHPENRSKKQFRPSHENRGIKHKPHRTIKSHRPIKKPIRHAPVKRFDKHYPRRHFAPGYRNDPFDSWFFSFSTVAPIYTTPGYATPYKITIWDRLKNYQRRINGGIRNGQLTRGEAQYLRQELDRIQNRIARFKADGRFGPHERSKIHRMMDRLEDNIYQRKHNGVTRGGQRDRDGYHYYH